MSTLFPYFSPGTYFLSMQVQAVTSMGKYTAAKDRYQKFFGKIWDQKFEEKFWNNPYEKFFGTKSFHFHLLFFWYYETKDFWTRNHHYPPPPPPTLWWIKFFGIRNFQTQRPPCQFFPHCETKGFRQFFVIATFMAYRNFRADFELSAFNCIRPTKLANLVISPKFLLFWVFNHLFAYVSSLIQNKMLKFEKFPQNVVPNVLSWKFSAI